MMHHHSADVRLRGVAEEKRWRRLRDDPVAMVFLQGGAKVAHTVFLPGLNAGHYGFTESEIRARMDRHIAAAVSSKDLSGLSMIPDERFMWRLGFEAVALPAIEHAMTQARTGAAAIIGAAVGVLPMVRPPGRRRLGADDFGALPAPPRT